MHTGGFKGSQLVPPLFFSMNLVEVLSEQVSALSQQLADFKSKTAMAFEKLTTEHEEKIDAIQEQMDKLYYIRGRVIACEADKHRLQIELWVAEEYDLSTTASFYKDNAEITDRSKEQTEVVARWVLFVLLNSHFAGMTMAAMVGIYGYRPNNARLYLKPHLARSAKDKAIFEELEKKVIKYIQDIRPNEDTLNEDME